MARARVDGFTLVELIVVVTLLALLLALLLPAVQSVWQTALMSQCAQRLRNLGTAQGVYRTGHNMKFATGLCWPRNLLPYVENDKTAFQCPAVAGTGTERSQAAAAGMHEFSYRFYGSNGGFIFELPVDESLACVRRTDLGASGYALGVEDYYLLELRPPSPNWSGSVPSGYLGEKDPFGKGGWDDVGFTIHMEDNVPVSAEVWGESEELLYRCEADFYIDGELVLANAWANRGATVALDKWVTISTDDGLSVGAYERATGDTPAAPDGKVFFILDYPKPLADYNRFSREDSWDKFFILDPDAWDYEDEVPEGDTWRCYQSLRHFNRANVLFCDGHVETLGVSSENATVNEIRAGKYLDETSPLWVHGGN